MPLLGLSSSISTVLEKLEVVSVSMNASRSDGLAVTLFV